MFRALFFFLLIVIVGGYSPARAEDAKFGGHLKLQEGIAKFRGNDLSAIVGGKTQEQHTLDLRLNFSKRESQFVFKAEGEVLGIAGDAFKTRKQFSRISQFPGSVGGLIDDRRRLLRLTGEIIDEPDSEMIARLDRLSAEYTSEQWVTRVGRQAISWGNGLVFQALDLFNPFSPVEIDKDYKTGDDMLYMQYLFGSGDDLQFLAIPRRDPLDGQVEEDQSSFATKLHGRAECFEIDYDLVGARHFGEYLAGIGVNREVLGAVARIDATFTELEDGEQVVSTVVNLDRSGVVIEKNIYGYIEYFLSGVGLKDVSTFPLHPELTDRISRGELFTLGRDYLAIGGRIEWTPLLNIYLNEILNLHDESSFPQLRATYDVREEFEITMGVNVPTGRRGSEFGGISAGSQGFLTPGALVYLRLSYFF